MVGRELVAAQAVAGDQRGAGPQHTGDLGEQPILQCDRRDMVQHRETRGAGEPVRRRSGRTVASPLTISTDGTSANRSRQHRGELVIDLDRRQPRHRLAEHVGGGAVAGPDLEHVVAEVGVAERPRQDRPRASPVATRRCRTSRALRSCRQPHRAARVSALWVRRAPLDHSVAVGGDVVAAGDCSSTAARTSPRSTALRRSGRRRCGGRTPAARARPSGCCRRSMRRSAAPSAAARRARTTSVTSPARSASSADR